jgi:hypothetical protein
MNTKDFLRLGVPLGEATRRAPDFVAQFILGGGDKSRSREEVAAIVANPSGALGLVLCSGQSATQSPNKPAVARNWLK